MEYSTTKVLEIFPIEYMTRVFNLTISQCFFSSTIMSVETIYRLVTLEMIIGLLCIELKLSPMFFI